MPELRRVMSRSHSIFAKLFFTMMAMAVVIIVIMTSFLFLFVAPTMGAAVDRAVKENVDLLVSSDPDRETLRRTASRLELDVRYEGHRGPWATDERMPSVAQSLRHNERWAKFHILGREYHIVRRPNGDTYVFSWQFYRSVHAAHNRLVLGLVLCIALVVLGAHGVLRQSIRPVEWLRAGFAQLSAGNLTVSVAKRSNDEFGVLTDEFNHMVERVREMVTSRDQLLLDVSHELRSPLTRMKVALALSDDDEQKAHLLGNVAEMETMVTELLELERLRNGRGLRLGDCDLARLLRRTVERMNGRAPGIHLMALPATLPVVADSQKIGMVFENLLENALKYSLPDSRPVEVTATVGDRAIEVSVDDDGPGIPEADLSRIFEPFFRVDRSRSRRTGGYGLGLSLCRRIVAAHQGDIRVSNRGQRGASFVVVLPIRPEQSSIPLELHSPERQFMKGSGAA